MAEYEKTLRWLEPYGGWHENDTGLCNRIFHWEVAFELSRHNDYEYQILLQRKYWPELSLIELPQTKVYTSTEGDSYNIDFLKCQGKTKYAYGFCCFEATSEIIGIPVPGVTFPNFLSFFSAILGSRFLLILKY